MITLVVANLKGGTTKTTSAGWCAHALHERGRRVVVVDADPQGSMIRWQEDADWQLNVIGLPSKDLHVRLPGIIGSRFDAVVIDTPPNDLPIVRSAMLSATHVLIPMPPTPADHERLPVVRELLDSVRALRADGAPVAAVLLTRAVTNAASTRAYRQQVTEDGWHVLRPHVGRVERFAQSYGSPVKRATVSAYGDALDELLTMTQEAV